MEVHDSLDGPLVWKLMPEDLLQNKSDQPPNSQDGGGNVISPNTNQKVMTNFTANGANGLNTELHWSGGGGTSGRIRRNQYTSDLRINGNLNGVLGVVEINSEQQAGVAVTFGNLNAKVVGRVGGGIDKTELGGKIPLGGNSNVTVMQLGSATGSLTQVDVNFQINKSTKATVNSNSQGAGGFFVQTNLSDGNLGIGINRSKDGDVQGWVGYIGRL